MVLLRRTTNAVGRKRSQLGIDFGQTISMIDFRISYRIMQGD